MARFLVIGATILLISQGFAAAQSRTTLVIAVDLTQSVAVKGPDGKSEFQKNIEAVTEQLANVPADARVTIIGITDHSFTQPNILLSATIPPDPGYFGERLTAARDQLSRTWRQRSAKLMPRYSRTDIIGVLLLAGQLFDQQEAPAQKRLLIYSDMRHSTPELNLESEPIVQPFQQTSVALRELIADLRNVSVDVIGVDDTGKSILYWHSLRQFWVEYLLATRANLRSYSVLRAGKAF